METTVQWLKEKFGISDEQIAEKQASEVESQKQSLTDQIANHTAEIATLQSQLDALNVAPSEEAAPEVPEITETPANPDETPAG